MSSFFSIDEIERFGSKLDQKDGKGRLIFKEKPGKAPFKISRILKKNEGQGKQARSFSIQNVEVWTEGQLKEFQQNTVDSCQIYVTSWDRSWTTLNISRRQFQAFMEVYGVFPQFWKYIFTFGQKSEENEFEFPGFRQRRSLSLNRSSNEILESAYMLRRVEENGRGALNEHSSWSTRQTAVYHRYVKERNTQGTSADQTNTAVQEPKSTFLLVCPSSNVEELIGRSLETCTADDEAVFPWRVQSLLVADSLKGWMDYMACLQRELKKQSDLIVIANTGTKKENLSPLDININFWDRQELKILEDAVAELEVILPTLQNTISRVVVQCRNCCEQAQTGQDQKYELERLVDEFEEYHREAVMLIERAKALNQRSHATTRLLSDLLSYEEAVAMKELAQESTLESKSMHQLAEKSTKDAAAVKILTIITLIYLPTTIVANFFSTEFVQTNDAGHMKVSRNAWLLAAIALPLTFVTIVLWWTWVHFTKVHPPPRLSDQSRLPKILRTSSFRSVFSSKRKYTDKDVESGLSSPQTPGFKPSPFRTTSPTVTWLTATTLQSG